MSGYQMFTPFLFKPCYGAVDLHSCYKKTCFNKWRKRSALGILLVNLFKGAY